MSSKFPIFDKTVDMNVQATKLELMQLILETNNSDLLDSLREVLTSYKQNRNGLVKLSDEEREAIAEGIEDFENGRFSDFDDFLKEFE